MSGGPALRVDPTTGSAVVIGLNIRETPFNSEEDNPQSSSLVAATRNLLPLQVAMVGPAGERITKSLLQLGADYMVSDTDFTKWRLQDDDAGLSSAVYSGDAPA